MRCHGLDDAAVIVLGHGSTQNDDSGAPVFQHAEALRHRGMFSEVREGFWKQEPRVQEVLSRLKQRRIFIVPLFVSEGYFSESVIPRELGFRAADGTFERRLLAREGQELHYCKPVGTHERMTEVILSRADQVARQYPFPIAPSPSQTTLFIAGHGTQQNADSRRAIETQVNLISARGIYAAVLPLFLEEEPRIESCYDSARTRNLIVVPFFISDGMHAQEDIPILLGEPERLVRERLARGRFPWRNPTERKGKLVWYTPSIGTDPKLTDVIVELVQAAAQS